MNIHSRHWNMKHMYRQQYFIHITVKKLQFS